MKASELRNGFFLITVWSNILILQVSSCRFQSPRGLRRGSAAARLLGMWVRITPGGLGYLSLVNVVGCAGRNLGSWPVPGPEDSYRVCVLVSVMKFNNKPLHLQLIRRRSHRRTFIATQRNFD